MRGRRSTCSSSRPPTCTASALLGRRLTGASADGTAGAMRIKRRGGSVVAQDPRTAESRVMPQSAITTGVVDQVLPLDEIAPYLNVAVVTHR